MHCKSDEVFTDQITFRLAEQKRVELDRIVSEERRSLGHVMREAVDLRLALAAQRPVEDEIAA